MSTEQGFYIAVDLGPDFRQVRSHQEFIELLKQKINFHGDSLQAKLLKLMVDNMGEAQPRETLPELPVTSESRLSFPSDGTVFYECGSCMFPADLLPFSRPLESRASGVLDLLPFSRPLESRASGVLKLDSKGRSHYLVGR